MKPGRKVPKAVVRRMIESGRYQVSLHGTSVTDWKKLFEDVPEDETEPVPDPEQPPMPITNMTVPPPSVEPFILPFDKGEPAYRTINEKKYRVRQLEHFGDSVVGLAARQMVYDLVQSDLRLYFHHTGRLITNKNLGHGNVRDGTELEVKVGTVWAEKGLEEAMKYACDLLRETAAWKALVKFVQEQQPPNEP
jgi:hypothetical protein